MGALAHAVRSGQGALRGHLELPARGDARGRRACCARWARRCSSTSRPTTCSSREPEDALFGVLADEGVGCIGFSPLASGLLTDTYLDGIPAGSRAAKGELGEDRITEALRDDRAPAPGHRARPRSVGGAARARVDAAAAPSSPRRSSARAASRRSRRRSRCSRAAADGRGTRDHRRHPRRALTPSPLALLFAMRLPLAALARVRRVSARKRLRRLPGTGRAPVSLRYLLARPDGYAEASEPWPLVLFLHGSGERGEGPCPASLPTVRREAARSRVPALPVRARLTSGTRGHVVGHRAAQRSPRRRPGAPLHRPRPRLGGGPEHGRIRHVGPAPGVPRPLRRRRTGLRRRGAGIRLGQAEAAYVRPSRTVTACSARPRRAGCAPCRPRPSSVCPSASAAVAPPGPSRSTRDRRRPCRVCRSGSGA